MFDWYSIEFIFINNIELYKPIDTQTADFETHNTKTKKENVRPDIIHHHRTKTRRDILLFSALYTQINRLFESSKTESSNFMYVMQ